MSTAIRILVSMSMVTLLLLSFMVTGCSKHPNEEQLQLLEETKAAALAAEQQLADCDAGKAELTALLDAKKMELANAEQEAIDVANRLAAMGNE